MSSFDISEEALRLVPAEVCRRHDVIPVNLIGQTLILAMADPANIYAIDDIKFITNCSVEAVAARMAAIHAAIRKHYNKPED